MEKLCLKRISSGFYFNQFFFWEIFLKIVLNQQKKLPKKFYFFKRQRKAQFLLNIYDLLVKMLKGRKIEGEKEN